MFNLALYILTIAIWGSTWILAKFQVDEVSALQSVFFRYVIAAVLLQGAISLMRSRNRHSWQTHGKFFLLGSFLFCVDNKAYVRFMYQAICPVLSSP